MKLKILTGLLVVFFCMASAYATLGSADNPAASTAGKSQKATATVPDKDNFKSDLQTPAMMSSLASKTLLNGITTAGKRVIAVGQRGHIVYSDDGGKSWTQVKVPVSVDLTAVYFPTPQKGWAVGQDGVVLHSTDGGLTWALQMDGSRVCQIMNKCYEDHSSSEGTDAQGAQKRQEDIRFLIKQGPVFPFLDVWFENDLNGFVVGAFNLIFHTTDGGKTWNPWFDRTENPDGLHLYSIRPAGGDLFISGELGLVLKFDRKTEHFKRIDTGYKGTFFGVLGEPGSVLVFGLRGHIYRSADGGARWQEVSSGENDGIFGGTVMKDGRIVLVTQSGKVLLSSNGGSSFTRVKRDTGLRVPACAVTAVDNNTLVVAGMTGIEMQKIQ